MESVADTSERYQGDIVKKLEMAIGADNVKTSKGETAYSHDMSPCPRRPRSLSSSSPTSSSALALSKMLPRLSR